MGKRYTQKTTKLTKEEQKEKLNALKFSYKEITDAKSHGQPIFFFKKLSIEGITRRNIYVSFDTDSHSGGTWKAATSIKNLRNNTTRLGSYNEDFSKKLSK